MIFNTCSGQQTFGFFPSKPQNDSLNNWSDDSEIGFSFNKSAINGLHCFILTQIPNTFVGVMQLSVSSVILKKNNFKKIN